MNPGDKILKSGTAPVESAATSTSYAVASGNDNPNYMSLPHSRMRADGRLLKELEVWNKEGQQEIRPSPETNLTRTHEDDITARTEGLRLAPTGWISNPSGTTPLNPFANTFTPLNNLRLLPTDSFDLATGNRSCRKESEEKYASKREKTILPNSSLDFPRLKSKPNGFIDTHCHLDYLFENEHHHGTHAEYMRMHRDSYPSNYEGCVAVFCDPFTFLQEGLFQKYLDEEGVWGAFGCHPHNARFYDDSKEAALCNVLLHSKVRALGEVGLDYSKRNNCPKQTQHEVLRRQLNIAMMLRLPVVIHCRDANHDCMEILKEVLPRDFTIHLHCFTGSWSQAQEWLSVFPNLFIGITNLVSYNSAKDTHEVARRIAMDRLLLETDAPYFVPRKIPRVSTRWSHPGMAIHVAHQIAALREVPLEEVLYWARRNTFKMYGI